MSRLVLSAIFALVAMSASAQDPQVVAPHAYNTQLENDWVRVTRVHYAPHETLSEHEHPARPAIFIYLNDGGPVLFKHQHGDSGDYAATRAATKAGAYRLAAGRQETHIVENRSDLPSDFLQVELKTDVDSTTFTGRRFRSPSSDELNSRVVEFESPQLRIVRVNCKERLACAAVAEPVTYPALLVAMASGSTTWLSPTSAASERFTDSGEHLLVEFTGRHRSR